MRSAVRDPVLILAVLVGAFVRLVPVVSSDFPVNDGGLFASIIDQLVGSGMRPPDHLEYNGAEIPFAYPPAGFYLAGLLVGLGVPTLEVLRFAPVVMAILLVPAWYLLARDLFDVRIAGAAAVIYAVLPRSYEWLVAGGGLTRALGLLLAVVALTAAVRYFRSGSRRALVIGGVSLGFCALSHPEAAAFGAASAVLFAWRQHHAWGRLAALGAISFAVAAPWFARVFVTYGAGPLINAGESRIGIAHLSALTELASLLFTREAYIILGAVICVSGLFIAATSGRAWLLGWIAIIVLVAPAAAPTFVMLPFSAAGAIALNEVVLPRLGVRARRIVIPAGLGVLILASVWSSHTADSSLWSLSGSTRASMRWASETLPDGAQVAVVTGAPWGRDAPAEWFPYLTGLVSVGTPQGTEFTDSWSARLEGQSALASCAGLTDECLNGALAEHFPTVDIVFIPKGRMPGSTSTDCCLALRESLRDSAEILYDAEGATIFRLGDQLQSQLLTGNRG